MIIHFNLFEKEPNLTHDPEHINVKLWLNYGFNWVVKDGRYDSNQ